MDNDSAVPGRVALRAKTTAVFAGALYAALLLVAVTDVLLLGHYDQDIGSRYANLWVRALVGLPVMLATTAGFGLGLLKRIRPLPTRAIPSSWVVAGAVVACGLVFAFSPIGYFLPEGRELLRMSVLFAFCVAVGAGLAIALVALRARAR